MLQPHEALDVILKELTPVTAETVSLFEAHGRVMARPGVSRRSIPPANTATLDGYAMRMSEVREGLRKFKVNGVIAAGDDTSGFETPAGTCWRIMTGAALPPDTDFIVMHENTDNSRTEMTIHQTDLERPGVRQKGEEAAVGDLLDHTGEALDMARMGALAARGIYYVKVYRKPRVVVLSTGGEVADPTELDNPSKIFDSNSVAIRAILQGAGCDVSYLGICPDDPDGLAATLKSLTCFDLIITTGGASAGDFDYFAREPERLGIKWSFYHVRQRPAQPISFGRANGIPMFALPGTPVGSILTALLYVKPAAKRLGGFKSPENTFFTAMLAEPIGKGVQCIQFNPGLCVQEDGVLKVYPRSIANYSVKNLATGNGFIRVNNGKSGTVEPGEIVEFIYFGDLPH